MLFLVCPFAMLTESIPVIRIARTRLEGFKRLFIVVVPVGLIYAVPLPSQANVRIVACAVEQVQCERVHLDPHRFNLSNWTVISIAYLQKRPISRVSAVGERESSGYRFRREMRLTSIRLEWQRFMGAGIPEPWEKWPVVDYDKFSVMPQRGYGLQAQGCRFGYPG